jgi:hypothetical protein
VIVEARDPRRIKRTSALATGVADHGKVEDVSEDERRQRGEAADSAVAGDQARSPRGP